MNGANRWQRIQTLFDAALERPPEAREAFLVDACGDDAALLAELRALLAADAADHSFLDGAAVDALTGGDLAALTGDASREGDTIGPYRILRTVGSGGMGRVFLAERSDGAFQQQVALKLIKRGMDSEQILGRFRTERQILARLQHANIARLYDGGLTGEGQPWFTMEYVDGRPIDRYCRETDLGLRGRLTLFREVCAAVGHAHRNLVVHRDLKPSNIQVTPEGRVKLLDFGIAKVLGDGEGDGGAALTHTGLRVMTPEYASPEQVRGEPVSTATDIYSLGMVLYELLTGERAYRLERRSAAEIERVVCDTAPSRPSTALRRSAADGAPRWRRQLRGDLDTICLKALQKDPARRYRSVEALDDDLQRYLDGRPVLARPDTLAYRSWKFVRRHTLGVAVAVLFAGLVGFYTVQLGVERDRARLEAAKARQVSDFLVGLFEVADPGRTRGEQVTARELLDRGAERLDAQLAGQPEVRASMMEVMGQVYHSLGLYGRADTLFSRSLALRAADGPGNPLPVAVALDHLGKIAHAQGDYPRADSLFTRALSRYDGHPGAAPAILAAMLFNRANLLQDMGEYDAAEPLYRRSLDLRVEWLGPDDVATAQTQNGLGKLLQDRGDYAAAEILLRAALATRKARFGRLHRDVAQSHGDLAFLLQDTRRLDEAEPLFREALAIDRALYGDDHPDVATDLYNLANLLHNKGDHRAAVPLYREVLAMDIRQLGPEHPYVALSRNNLAGVLAALGERAEPESLYFGALELQRRVLGAEHPEVATTMSNIGDFLRRNGEIERARPWLDAALDLRRRLLGADHPHVAITLNHLGDLYLAAGRPAEAEPYLRDAWALRSASTGDDDPSLIAIRLSLGRLALLEHRLTAADSLYRQALDVARDRLPERHPNRLGATVGLAETLLKQGAEAAADSLLQDALRLVDGRLPDDHREVERIRRLLGERGNR